MSSRPLFGTPPPPRCLGQKGGHIRPPAARIHLANHIPASAGWKRINIETKDSTCGAFPACKGEPGIPGAGPVAKDLGWTSLSLPSAEQEEVPSSHAETDEQV